MKIKRVHIKNFRAIKDDQISANSFNSFVGPNGVGKSTYLHALNVFFWEITTFSENDFWKKDVENVIEIAVTFDSFSPEAKTDFGHYIRNGEMTVIHEITKTSEGKFERKARGERLVFEPFMPFFELPKAPAAARTDVFKELRKKYPEIVSATSGDAREAALREYEEALDADQKIVARSGDDFFGASKGIGVFKKHIFWVYVPAVKDAAAESQEGRSSHLGKLIQHTVRATMDYDEALTKVIQEAKTGYEKLLSEQKHHLKGLEQRIEVRLKESVTSNAGLALDWKNDDQSVQVAPPTALIQLIDRGFQGDVGNFGHGLQRAFLIVILQELLSVESEHTPTLLLGIEEPELYQHPPQAKHLAAVLMTLAETDAQVFITTHSPYFVDAKNFNGLQKIRNTDAGAVSKNANFETVLNAYNQHFDENLKSLSQAQAKLGIQIQPKYNELFFRDNLLIVEGISDQACIESYLSLSERASEFQKAGISIVVSEGKSSLILLLLIARSYKIPFHVIFDCDGNCNDNHKLEHERDNKAAFSLADYQTEDFFPNSHILEKRVSAWADTIDSVLDEQFGENLENCREAGRKAVGHLPKYKKNPFFISAAMAEGWNLGCQFPVFSNLVTRIVENSTKT